MHSSGAFVALVAAFALAACGGASPKHRGSTGPYGPTSSPAAVSRCLRANGVSGFPDPSAGPGGVGFNALGVSSSGTIIVDGRTFSGPAVRAAEKACKEYLPGGSGPPPQLSEKQKLAAIANAQCMRRHGIPLPDPTFAAAGKIAAPVGAGINPASPAFQAAAKACGGLAERIRIGAP